MINRKYRQKIHNKMKISVNIFKITKILLITLLISIVVLFILRPGIQEAISYQCKAIATKTIAEEASKTLSKLDIKYDDLIKTQIDSDGKITSAYVNSIKANEIKNTLESSITAHLMDFKRHTYKVPLGTILGSDWLSGRGPLVSLKISPVGYVKTELISEFKSAGINQTSHQIILKIDVDVSAVIPLYKTDSTTTTNLLIAQTIIVGDVPKFYSDSNIKREKLNNET